MYEHSHVYICVTRYVCVGPHVYHYECIYKWSQVRNFLFTCHILNVSRVLDPSHDMYDVIYDVFMFLVRKRVSVV